MLLKIVIVGGGAIGSHAAQIFSKKNHKIIIIEKNADIAKELANSIDALVINDDGTDILALRNAEVESCDAILALTGDDKSNLMICEIAKNLGVNRIISRVNTPGNEELFVKFGINMLVPITQNAVNTIDNHLTSAGIRVLAELGNNKAQIFELLIPQSSKLVGHTGPKIDGGTINAIYRNGLVLFPEKSTAVNAGDVLIITAKVEHFQQIIKLV